MHSAHVPKYKCEYKHTRRFTLVLVDLNVFVRDCSQRKPHCSVDFKVSFVINTELNHIAVGRRCNYSPVCQFTTKFSVGIRVSLHQVRFVFQV